MSPGRFKPRTGEEEGPLAESVGRIQRTRQSQRRKESLPEKGSRSSECGLLSGAEREAVRGTVIIDKEIQ